MLGFYRAQWQVVVVQFNHELSNNSIPTGHMYICEMVIRKCLAEFDYCGKGKSVICHSCSLGNMEL